MKKGLLKGLAIAVALTFVLGGCGTSDSSNSTAANTADSTTSDAAKDNQGSDKSWDKVKEKGEFVLGLDENFPPMGFKDDSGEIVGYDIDLATEVCSRLGVTLKIQPINWDAKDVELNTGNIDCIWNGFTIKEDRKKTILFTEPYMDNQQVLVVKGDSPYNTIDDLKGKKVSLQAGSSAADALNSRADFKDTLKEVAELKDNSLCLMDLETGATDAVVMDEIVARYYIQMKKDNYKVLDGLTSEQYGIGFRINDVALMNKVQDTLKEMAKDGTIKTISEKWFGKDISTIK